MLKCFSFVDCLPDEEKTRAKYFLKREQAGLENLCQRFKDDNQGLLPRYAFNRKWELCKPKSRKWKDLLAWRTEWNQLAGRDGKILLEDFIGQIDTILMKFHPSAVKRIHECEVCR